VACIGLTPLSKQLVATASAVHRRSTPRNIHWLHALYRREEAILDSANYYAQLEQGARYLASLATSDAERHVHLSWANRYHRLRVDAEPQPAIAPIAA
jgi:hypothetical protein